MVRTEDEGKDVVTGVVKKTASIILAVFVLLTINFIAYMVSNPLDQIMISHSLPSEYWDFVEEARLNDSLDVQFIDYITDTLTWELRPSLFAHGDIQDFILGHIWRTGILLVIALFGSLTIGALLERLAHSGKAERRALLIHGCGFIAFVPVFAIAYFIWRANLEWGNLPLSGVSAFIDEDESYIVSMVKITIMPLLAILLSTIGLAVLMLREGLLKSRIAGPCKGPWTSTFALGLVRLRPLAHFYVAWTMITVLIVDIPFIYGGLGTLMLESLVHLDLPGLMAATFIIPLITMMTASALSLALHLVSKRGVRPALNDWVSRDPMPPANPPTIAREGVKATAWGLSVWRAFRSGRVGMAALVAFAALMVLGVLAPVLATVPDPAESENFERMVSPRNPLPPSFDRSEYTGWIHPLGTDIYGRDVYSMWLYSARKEVAVALGLTIVCVVVGVVIGLLSREEIAGNRNARIAARLADFALTVGARASVATPLLVIVAARTWTDWRQDVRWLLLYFILLAATLAWGWILIARPIRDEARRAGGRIDSGWVAPTALAQSLSVAKFAVPAVMLTMFVANAAGFLLIIEYDWGEMCSHAFDLVNPLYAVVPCALGMLLLCASLFVLLDRLENAVRVTPSYPRRQ